MTQRTGRIGRRKRTVGKPGWLAAAAALVLLATPGGVALAADVTLTDLRFEVGPTVIRIPRAEFRGTPSSREELQALVAPSGPEGAAARLARIQADQIVLAEVRSEATEPHRAVTVYRNVVMTKVGGGRIETSTAESATIETDTPRGTGRGSFGRMTTEGVDLGASLALMSPGDPSAPMRTLYSRFTMDGVTFSDPKGTTFRIGRLVGNDMAARPTKEGWTATTLALQPDNKPGGEDPEARKRRSAAMADILDSFRIGTMEASGITVADGDKPLGKLDRLAFTGSTDTAGAGFRFDGLEGTTPEVGFRLGSFEIGGVSLKPLIEGLRTMGDADPETLNPADFRRFIPIVGLVRMTGLEIGNPSAPGSPASAPAADGQKNHEGGPSARPAAISAGSLLSIGQVELVTGKPVEGIPTDIRFGISHVAFGAPSPFGDDASRQIAELGYSRVDASVVANLGWNEPGQEVVVRELSAQGAGMGSAVVRGVVGGVSRQAFGPDKTTSMMALLGVSAKSLEIGLEDKGLFDRILTRQAKRQKRSVEDIRREYGTAASIGIPAILGNAPGAKALAQAIARFIAKPNRLLLAARAKNPSGYGFTDYMSGSDPASILGALEITAVAE